MSDGLVVPEGWSRKTLGGIGRYLNGRAFKTSEWSKKGRPIIRIQDLTGSNRNPNYFEGEVADRYVVRPGDFLISWSATLGAYIWDGPEGVLNQHIFKVESDIDRRFHYHLVRGRIAELERNAHGSGMVHVTKGAFESTPVAVPDDREVQRQLAAVIDRVERSRDSSASHLSRAHRAVAQFCQAVLAAACSGRLTADWREAHPDQTAVEVPAVDPMADSKTKRAVEEFNAIELPALPKTWAWVPLAAVATSVLGKMLDKTKNRGVPRPYLRNSNVRWRGFGLDDLLEMRFEAGEEDRYGLLPGDVLVCEGGEPGRAAVWREAESDLRFQKALHRVRSSELLFPDWLVSVLQAHASSGLLSDFFTGSGIAHLTGVSLARVPLPLPPLEEQVEAARRIDQLLALADDVQDRLGEAASRIDASSLAVLTKALQGGLTGAGTSEL